MFRLTFFEIWIRAAARWSLRCFNVLTVVVGIWMYGICLVMLVSSILIKVFFTSRLNIYQQTSLACPRPTELVYTAPPLIWVITLAVAWPRCPLSNLRILWILRYYINTTLKHDIHRYIVCSIFNRFTWTFVTVAARVYFHQTSRESMGVIFSPAADGPALHVRAGPLSRPRALAAALGARTPWRPFGPLALTQPGHR